MWMKIEVEIAGGVLQFKQMPENFKDGIYEVEIKNMDSRTLTQNASLHLWMTQIANILNRENIPLTQVLKADITWNLEKVKWMIMKPLVEALFHTTTTTKLNKGDFYLLINTLTKMMGMRGITIPPFPSIENKGK